MVLIYKARAGFVDVVFVTQSNGHKVNVEPPYCNLLSCKQSEGPEYSYQNHNLFLFPKKKQKIKNK